MPRTVPLQRRFFVVKLTVGTMSGSSPRAADPKLHPQMGLLIRLCFAPSDVTVQPLGLWSWFSPRSRPTWSDTLQACVPWDALSLCSPAGSPHCTAWLCAQRWQVPSAHTADHTHGLATHWSLRHTCNTGDFSK